MRRAFARAFVLALVVSLTSWGPLHTSARAPVPLTSADEGYIQTPVAEFRTDPDGNRLFEALVLRIPFVINASGHFYFRTYVVANNSRAFNYTEAVLLPGTYPLDFALPGWAIRLLRSDGPYDVDVSMYDGGTGFYTNRTYRTAVYSWSTFEFLAELQDGFAEQPVDANGDGLYNYLEIRGVLNVTAPQNYTLTADLYVRDSASLAYTSNRTYWAAGASEFILRFSGEQIRQSYVDGPYRVEVRLTREEYFDVWQVESFSTRPYAASQYDHKPILFRGNVSDTAVDEDGNGRPDVLRIEIPITVTVTGSYRISGSLSGPNYFSAYAQRDVTLSPADRSVALDFDGFAIHNFYYDTSFGLDLYILELASPYWIHTAASTAVYAPADFDNPYANWLSDLHVTTLDRNSDGLFDELRLNATFRAKRPGTFGVDFVANLGYNGYIDYIEAWQTVTADPGLISVEASFPAWRIRAAGSNGTYRFFVSLSIDSYSLEHLSAEGNYTYDRFAPALSLRGPISYRTVDNDADGLANQAVAIVPLRVYQSGIYDFGAAVYNASSYSFTSRTRYLDPGNVDLEFPFSGILLRLLGANTSLYFSASVEWSYSRFDVLTFRDEGVISDPSIFQTAPTKTVAFATNVPPTNSCCGILRLVNYSNAFVLDINLDSQGHAMATIPDLAYLGMADLFTTTGDYQWVGRIFAPLPSNVTLNLKRSTLHLNESLDVDLMSWSSGRAWLNRTLHEAPFYRLSADLGYEPDGVLATDEILNLFHVLNFGLPLGIVLKADNSSVLASAAGPEEGFGAGSVESGDPIALATPWSLTLPGNVSDSHRLVVNLTSGSPYLTPSARLRMPPGWSVTAATSTPGVVVVGVGTREVSIMVTENRSTPSDTVLTVNVGGGGLARGQISGRVLGVGGAAVAGVEVEVFRLGVQVGAATTDSKGRFIIANLLQGTYEIRIQAADYVLASRTVLLGSAQSLVLEDIQMESLTGDTGSLMGRVINDSGGAMTDVSVFVLSGSGDTTAQTRSSSDGRFEIEGVRPGSLTVRVEAPGFVTREIPIRIAAGQTTDLADVIMSRAAPVGGAGGWEPFVVPILAGLAIVGVTVVVLRAWRRSGRSRPP